jgi:antirestriction protein ArdC
MMTIYQLVTDNIISELERGATPWVKPWTADSSADANVISGKAYKGINRLLLGCSSMSKGYSSAKWATYKQWLELGANVRKGEKATAIVYFQPVVKPVADAESTDGGKSYALLKQYFVFNANQVDGYTDQASEVDSTFNSIALADDRIIKTGAMIRHGGDAAFYSPSNDSIQLPYQSSFNSTDHYYATAFHELTHWTSAKARCDRVLGKRFGDSKYAFEELVAEMGAAFLCFDHGITGQLQHAGYIANWLQCLRDDNKAVFKAAALAQKAADYINGLDATKGQLAA